MCHLHIVTFNIPLGNLNTFDFLIIFIFKAKISAHTKIKYGEIGSACRHPRPNLKKMIKEESIEITGQKNILLEIF